jgi:hypothetical protein
MAGDRRRSFQSIASKTKMRRQRNGDSCGHPARKIKIQQSLA